MQFIDFYFYYVKVFLKVLSPLCLKTTDCCGMCNCAYFCCWVSKNVHLATFPEAVNVYLFRIVFRVFKYAWEWPPCTNKKQNKDSINSILCVMDMWRGTAVCLVLAQFRCPSQLSFGHARHEKNGNVELICFPTWNEQSSINSAMQEQWSRNWHEMQQWNHTQTLEFLSVGTSEPFFFTLSD